MPLLCLVFEIQLQLEVEAGHDQHAVLDGDALRAEVCLADVVGLKANGDQMASVPVVGMGLLA